MTEGKKAKPLGGREARLRAALRENLRRRKAQAKGREQAGEGRARPSHDSAGFVPDKPKH